MKKEKNQDLVLTYAPRFYFGGAEGGYVTINHPSPEIKDFFSYDFVESVQLNSEFLWKNHNFQNHFKVSQTNSSGLQVVLAKIFTYSGHDLENHILNYTSNNNDEQTIETIKFSLDRFSEIYTKNKEILYKK